jgi:HD-GYP domain-containing protein (c-di-GMP phosphodiesterase class II)
MSDARGRDPVGADGSPPEDFDAFSVLHAQSVARFSMLQSDLVGLDTRMADLFLRFATRTSEVRNDEPRLMSVIAEFTFQAFPQATHLVVALSEPGAEEVRSLVAVSRAGNEPRVKLSTTLVRRVIEDGVAVLYTPTQAGSESSKSITLSRIQTALCAPLFSIEEPFGVIQLDIRHPGTGTFARKDVDRIIVFAHHVALVLDNLRLYQEQRRAFESTIRALVHSLSLKDPDTAHHSERVQALAVLIGEEMGLHGDDLESLGVAAVLHDMGKQGIRDEVLLKPARLSKVEREEMSRHSELTQNVLDKIAYPRHLRDVPLYAAYHHEKVNGTGPYHIPGDRIPIQSRIISVADVFDALFSARVYKEPKPVEEVLAILERGKGKEWDAGVVDAVHAMAPRLLARVYGRVSDSRGKSKRRAA